MDSVYEASFRELLEIKKRLLQSCTMAETILTEIPDGILLITEDGHISTCNAQAKEILGIPGELSILNQPFTKFFPEDFFGFSICELLTQNCKQQTLRLTLSQGDKQRDVEIFVRKRLHHALFLLIRDRSEYRQLEHAVERYRTISELGKVTATLAHEIRNPLNGIAGFAYLLKEELSSPHHQRMLTAIIEGTRSLNNLVSSMLEYTKPQLLQLKRVDLQDIFNHLIPLLSITFPSCCFIRESSDPLPRSVDPDRLYSAIWNLVKNAAEETEAPFYLTLHSSGNISVKNPGTLSEQVRKKLFTPFFTTKPTGNGLGLAEAQKIMRLHGGDIHVEANDGMVTFILTLPNPAIQL